MVKKNGADETNQSGKETKRVNLKWGAFARPLLRQVRWCSPCGVARVALKVLQRVCPATAADALASSAKRARASCHEPCSKHARLMTGSANCSIIHTPETLAIGTAVQQVTSLCPSERCLLATGTAVHRARTLQHHMFRELGAEDMHTPPNSQASFVETPKKSKKSETQAVSHAAQHPWHSCPACAM